MAAAMSEPLTVVPNPTHQEQANELRTRLTKALEAVCSILDDAVRAGFVVRYTTQMDQFARQKVGEIVIARHY